LLPPNHYLAVAISTSSTPTGLALGGRSGEDGGEQPDDRSSHLKDWSEPLRGTRGFKWFVDGLLDGSCLRGEESAGPRLSRRKGEVWTTDKDGIVPALLSAEITARMGRDAGELYTRAHPASSVSLRMTN